MPVLVTGGTGFLGRHVVERLRTHGHEVRVLARGRRSTREVQEAGAQLVQGSVLEADRVEEAVQGCEVVLHLAGRVERDRRSLASLRQLHVEGTRRVVEASARLGVRRLVYASTSGTIAVSRDPYHVATERDPAPDALIARWPYYATKLEAERLALALASACGLPLVCLNPSLLLGPGDAGRSSTRDVADVLAGRVPALPSGGLSFVDVRDVAEVFVAAMTQGQAGERYLLGAANWSLERFIQRVAALGGVRPPRLRAPESSLMTGTARWAARLSEALFHKLGWDPPVDPVTLEMSQVYWYLSADNARAALGFAPRDPDTTLLDTVRDLQRPHHG